MTEMTDVADKLRAVARGELSFDALKAQFEAATFTVRQPTKGGWGAVWLRAEEDMHDDDIPHLLATAKFARQVSPAQYETLMGVYLRRLAARG